jgi:hypothetical protein
MEERLDGGGQSRKMEMARLRSGCGSSTTTRRQTGLRVEG